MSHKYLMDWLFQRSKTADGTQVCEDSESITMFWHFYKILQPNFQGIQERLILGYSVFKKEEPLFEDGINAIVSGLSRILESVNTITAQHQDDHKIDPRVLLCMYICIHIYAILMSTNAHSDIIQKLSRLLKMEPKDTFGSMRQHKHLPSDQSQSPLLQIPEDQRGRILEPEASDIEERKKELLHSSNQSVAPKNSKKRANGKKKSEKLCHNNSDGNDPVMTRQSSYQAWAASEWGLGAVGCGILVSSTSNDTILYLYDECVCLEWLLLVALLFIFSSSLINPTVAFESLPLPLLLLFPMDRDGRCEHKHQPNQIHASDLATHLIVKRPFKKKHGRQHDDSDVWSANSATKHCTYNSTHCNNNPWMMGSLFVPLRPSILFKREAIQNKNKRK
ncbi:hypothetical protein RFI_29784 [Reticulomyxa filosa]|uniref:Uncharacterized protein n=1 Tax=Reticulomyxa filosa TaxID=46433 RepID=X6M094_RETFI|nr:hypothetical protein RFI_29784 [Reticulomyxa filosa]|eukprot:ETO07608.1 hypothetical protein RFI_29784 [Reticulomyxa filosa]